MVLDIGLNSTRVTNRLKSLHFIDMRANTSACLSKALTIGQISIDVNKYLINFVPQLLLYIIDLIFI